MTRTPLFSLLTAALALSACGDSTAGADLGTVDLSSGEDLAGADLAGIDLATGDLASGSCSGPTLLVLDGPNVCELGTSASGCDRIVTQLQANLGSGLAPAAGSTFASTATHYFIVYNNAFWMGTRGAGTTTPLTNLGASPASAGLDVEGLGGNMVRLHAAVSLSGIQTFTVATSGAPGLSAGTTVASWNRLNDPKCQVGDGGKGDIVRLSGNYLVAGRCIDGDPAAVGTVPTFETGGVDGLVQIRDRLPSTNVGVIGTDSAGTIILMDNQGNLWRHADLASGPIRKATKCTAPTGAG